MNIQFPDEYFAKLWNEIDWEQAEEALAQLQKELALAACARDTKRITELQKRIVRLDEAKLLAVRHICSSPSGPGVDGEKWVRPEQKMKGALSLTSDGYQAKPLRMIITHSKSTGKDRHIGVPTFYDRSMQKLYSYSLAPVAEAMADRKSFAFRPGRSMQDASAYILAALKGNNAPEYGVVADVKACYATIQHGWLLSNIPMDKKVLREFLKCGHVFAGELFPAEETGISLGANLSPLLGNLALDGLQKYLYAHLYPDMGKIDYLNGNMIRWADDVFITARTEQGAKKILSILEGFLEMRGLALSRSKSKVVNIKDGVTFLSRTYIKTNGVVRSFPSVEAVERVKGELGELILAHKKSQRSLIKALNGKLSKWAAYHRYSDAYDAFREVDAAVQAFLLKAALNRHPKMQRAKVISKYWYRKANGQHVYALPDQKDIQVISLADVMFIEHRKVATNKNYYIDTDYFEVRNQQKAIERVNADFRPIWERQEGRCYYCNRPILPDQQRTLVQRDLNYPASKRNMVYIHTICKPNELIRCDTIGDISIFSDFEIFELLNDIYAAKNKPAGFREKGQISDDWKYIRLKNFFADSTAVSITLTFTQIEEINGQALPQTARKSSSFWYPRSNFNAMAEAWITESYQMARLDIEKETVRFQRCREGLVHIRLPQWLTDRKIPDDARCELENYFEHIKRKYNL